MLRSQAIHDKKSALVSFAVFMDAWNHTIHHRGIYNSAFPPQRVLDQCAATEERYIRTYPIPLDSMCTVFVGCLVRCTRWISCALLILPWYVNIGWVGVGWKQAGCRCRCWCCCFWPSPWLAVELDHLCGVENLNSAHGEWSYHVVFIG